MKAADFIGIRDALFDTFSDFISDCTVQDQYTAGSTYDPTTGGWTEGSYGVSIAAKAYLRNYRGQQLGGEIQAGDVQILLKLSSPEIQPNAIVTVGSTKYTVISNDPVTKSQGVIQRLQCRGQNA